jgi:hypothetical protein
MTLSGDSEQVRWALNEIYEVIDMDLYVSCEQYMWTRHSSVRKEPVSKFEKMFRFRKFSHGSTLLTRRNSPCGLAGAARHMKKGSPASLAPASLRLALCQ